MSSITPYLNGWNDCFAFITNSIDPWIIFMGKGGGAYESDGGLQQIVAGF